MKNRKWSKISLTLVFAIMAFALLSSMSTANSKETASSLTVAPGQEIMLNNQKIVVGKIENGQAEIFVYQTAEIPQPTPDKPDKSDPCSDSGKDPKPDRDRPRRDP
jgi:hypothetical protein